MKRSQTEASSIATFIFLMALFIVIYILLIPPADREELLNSNTTSNNENMEELNNEILLEQEPGKLKITEDDSIIHNIPSINLYQKEEPLVKDLANTLYLEKSLTTQTKRNLIFNADDLENLEKVTLIFVVLEGKGNLIINLNGIDVYNSYTTGLVNIILPKDLLQETNSIKFSVSSPIIFGKNKYTLTNVKVRESYELTNTKETRTIEISDQETGNAKLRYFLYCNKDEGARLRIFMNEEEIENQIISCSSVERKMDISNDNLVSGENQIMFEIDRGDYLFNRIEFETETNTKGYVSYKFPLTKNQYNQILDDDVNAVLYLDFNDRESKKATISMNGNEFTLDTTNVDYERDISRLIEEGTNFIRIYPENEFNVDLLRIRLE
jgi:hypothetical protein